jgi:hypothetical protein
MEHVGGRTGTNTPTCSKSQHFSIQKTIIMITSGMKVYSCSSSFNRFASPTCLQVSKRGGSSLKAVSQKTRKPLDSYVYVCNKDFGYQTASTLEIRVRGRHNTGCWNSVAVRAQDKSSCSPSPRPKIPLIIVCCTPEFPLLWMQLENIPTWICGKCSENIWTTHSVPLRIAPLLWPSWRRI